MTQGRSQVLENIETTEPVEAPSEPWPPIQGPEFATMGPVHLDVTERDRSLAFWRDLVGLAVLRSDEAAIELGAGPAGRPLIVLRAVAERAALRGHSGLYHVAIHLPNEAEFARVLARLITARHPISPTDHVMSKAIYLNDADRLMLELTLETPERVRRYAVSGDGGLLDIVDNEGRRRGGTEPLDVEQVLRALPDRDFSRPLPEGTKIGHVHLHVDDLETSTRFYRDVLGFIENTYAPNWGMADLYAGGRFPHRIALNTWQGAGAPQPPAGTAGLRHFTVRYDSERRLEEALQRAGRAERRSDGGVVRDPAGNAVLLTT